MLPAEYSCKGGFRMRSPTIIYWWKTLAIIQRTDLSTLTLILILSEHIRYTTIHASVEAVGSASTAARMWSVHTHRNQLKRLTSKIICFRGSPPRLLFMK